MVFQPPAVLKVMPWGKVQLKKGEKQTALGYCKRQKLHSFFVTPCEGPPCKAARPLQEKQPPLAGVDASEERAAETPARLVFLRSLRADLFHC